MHYAVYAARVESLFRAPIVGALDEYGIPPPVGEKLLSMLGTRDDLDAALTVLRSLPLATTSLSPFEMKLVADAKAGL